MIASLAITARNTLLIPSYNFLALHCDDDDCGYSPRLFGFGKKVVAYRSSN
jgi:hypothetical protein